jgi:NADPH-ferrihemoprotein reductase
MDNNGLGADAGDQHDQLVDDQVCEAVPYFVFGLGNKTYEQYNAIGRRLNARMKQLGGLEICKYGEGDDDGVLEENFLSWKTTIMKSVAEYYGIISDESSRKAKLHIPIFNIEFGNHSLIYSGELSSGTFRSWRTVTVNDDLINLHKRDCELIKKNTIGVLFVEEKPIQPCGPKHPHYGRLNYSRSLFKQSMDASNFGSVKVIDTGLEHDIKTNKILVERKCFHMEFDLTSSGLTYKTGDHVGIMTNNTLESVEEFTKILKIERIDETFELIPNPANPLSATTRNSYPTPCTIRTCLTYYLDIQAFVKQHHFEVFFFNI